MGLCFSSTNKVSGHRNQNPHPLPLTVAKHRPPQTPCSFMTVSIQKEPKTQPRRKKTPPQTQTQTRQTPTHGGRTREKAGGNHINGRRHGETIPYGKRVDFGYAKDFENRYNIGKLLGHGQFGYTYVATDKKTADRVAVKKIDKAKMTIPIAVEDVKREVKILQALTGHENVVRFYNAFEDKNSVYIVMELCEGGELLDRILARKDSRYSERDAAVVVRQMLKVAAECHLRGLVHRDMKPENFLFKSTEENSPLKATDFGLSDFIKPGKKFHDIVGSAYYVAPEVLKRRSGPESDVWSIGVISYILLCGRRPFWDKTEDGIFKEVLKNKPDFRRKPWPNITTITVDFQLCFIFILLWLFSLFCFYAFFFKKPKDFDLPPSPPSIPIIGHLHLLFSIPVYRSLHKLSSKYGPLLHLRVFNRPIVLVSSGSMAYEVFRTHDQNFPTRDRLPPLLEKSLLLGSYSFVTASCGDYWKFMKKLLLTNLVGTQALERTRLIREEEVKTFRAMLFDKAAKNEAVDVGKEILKVTNNSICRMIMGRRYSEENGEAEQIRDLVTISLRLMWKLVVANSVGRLLKKLTGILLFEKDLMEVSMKYDVLFEKVIKEHEENPNQKDDGDMMDVLLEVCADENAEIRITKNHIKSLFVEIFIGGSDTVTQTTLWTMGELINHPEILKRLRDEIESVVGKTRLIQESDLSSLPYLQAVVKEGLRLHPPSPIVLRNSTEACKIGGFDIAQNTTVIVNTYAVMRDPKSWVNPDEFQPERFMDSPSKDNLLSLKYIPFGSGRRGCPGSHLGYSLAEVAIGTMVQCFEWKINGDKVNMEETGSMTVIKAHPLMSTPVALIDPLTN